jgi:cytochrome c5
MHDQHASPIKTPKQLVIVVALAFIVPITIIILLVTFVVGGHVNAVGSASMTPEAVADRLKPIGAVTFAEGGGAKTLQTGEAVFKLSCAACHATGAAGAPKAGDATAWGPRIKKGYETLVKHATEGFNAMPAKGGNADLDPIEVARAVAYMANLAGASFKAPEPPATPALAAAPK